MNDFNAGDRVVVARLGGDGAHVIKSGTTGTVVEAFDFEREWGWDTRVAVDGFEGSAFPDRAFHHDELQLADESGDESYVERIGDALEKLKERLWAKRYEKRMDLLIQNRETPNAPIRWPLYWQVYFAADLIAQRATCVVKGHLWDSERPDGPIHEHDICWRCDKVRSES